MSERIVDDPSLHGWVEEDGKWVWDGQSAGSSLWQQNGDDTTTAMGRLALARIRLAKRYRCQAISIVAQYLPLTT